MKFNCSICKADKELSEFPKSARAYGRRNPRYGYASWCKICNGRKSLRRKVGTPQWRLASIKRCAKGRGISWQLTREQAMTFWQAPCSYCGSPIETVGLDRVDHTRSYTMDNIVPCCRLCNVMKFTLSPEEFLAHCRKIVEHAKTLGSREVA